MIKFETNFPAIQLKIEKLIEETLPEIQLEHQQDVAEYLMERLQKWNPFLTGLSVGNWIVNKRPTRFASERGNPGGYAQLRAGIAKIGKFRKPGTIYITNNTPYITYLEYGIGNGGRPVTYSNRHPELGIARISALETKTRFGG